MIEIKINNKKTLIPTYSELTVKQYSDLMPFIAKGDFIDVLRYICITTGADYRKSLHFKLKGVERLNRMLGEFKFIAGDKEAAGKIGYIETTGPKLIFKYKKAIYDLRSIKLDAIGYRILLEQYINTKPNHIQLYTFMTAIIIGGNFDYDETYKVIRENLQNYNAYQVLSIGAFFFFKWKRNERKESLILRMLKRVMLTNIRQKRRKLVLIDSRSISR